MGTTSAPWVEIWDLLPSLLSASIKPWLALQQILWEAITIMQHFPRRRLIVLTMLTIHSELSSNRVQLLLLLTRCFRTPCSLIQDSRCNREGLSMSTLFSLPNLCPDLSNQPLSSLTRPREIRKCTRASKRDNLTRWIKLKEEMRPVSLSSSGSERSRTSTLRESLPVLPTEWL